MRSDDAVGIQATALRLNRRLRAPQTFIELHVIALSEAIASA